MTEQFSHKDIDFMRRCAHRELDKRKTFYPKWVANGKMTQEKADFELKGMQKICEHFDLLQIKNPEQQKLF